MEGLDRDPELALTCLMGLDYRFVYRATLLCSVGCSASSIHNSSYADAGASYADAGADSESGLGPGMEDSSADVASDPDMADSSSERDHTQVDANDTQPPQVVSVSPVDGAANVATRSLITVTFDEPMDAHTVTDATFKVVRDGNPEAGVLSIAGKVVTFTPTHPLRMFSQYQVTLDASVTDLAGHPMSKAYAFLFHTGDGAWGAASDLSGGAGVSRNGYIAATDPGGDELVLFDDGLSCHTAAYTEAAGWHTSLAPASIAIASASMALAESGNALMAWIEPRVYRGVLLFSLYSPTAGWTPMGEDVERPADMVSAGIDDNGTGVIVSHRLSDVGLPAVSTGVWSQTVESGLSGPDTLLGAGSLAGFALDGAGNGLAIRSDDQQYLHRYSKAKGWESGEAIAQATSCSGLTMNHAGDAFLFCRNGTSEMIARRYHQGTSSAPQKLDAFSPTSGLVAVAVNESGDAVVIFSKKTMGMLQPWSISYASGQWQSAMLIQANPYPGEADWAAALDETGNAWVVWSELDDTDNMSVRAARSLAGMPWSAPTILDRPHNGSAFHSILHMHAHGTATLFWMVEPNAVFGLKSTLWTTRFE